MTRKMIKLPINIPFYVVHIINFYASIELKYTSKNLKILSLEFNLTNEFTFVCSLKTLQKFELGHKGQMLLHTVCSIHQSATTAVKVSTLSELKL